MDNKSTSKSSSQDKIKVPKSICLFNHKGGVSKTTTTFNLGWALADTGKKVLMVDLDSQCNLTGMVLGFDKLDDGMDSFYQNRDNLTLGPIVEYLINGGQPETYLSMDKGKIHSTLHENLFLIPGHLDVSDLDSQISVSLKIAAGIPATRNIPGNLPKILQQIALANGIDYILYDLSPNVGGLNEVILMSSDYFIVPAAPDFFCWQAIHSLSKNIPKWHNEIMLFKNGNEGNSSSAIKNQPQFLGMIQQRYRPRKGSPAKSFEKWMNSIREAVDSTLVPNLGKIKCIVPRETVQTAIENSDASADLSAYDLAHISDFNSLIAISQQLSTPVFSITDEQIKDSGQFGHALTTMKSNRDSFNEQFKALAQRVLQLTN